MSTVVHCRRRTRIAQATRFEKGTESHLDDLLTEDEVVMPTGDGSGRVIVYSDDSTRLLAPGDYLVRDHMGGLTVVSPESFKEDYEVVRP